MAASDFIEKVVILFFENHTFDNLASDVAGVDGNTALPEAPDVMVKDPNHRHEAWMARNDPPPGGAVRLRYMRAQVPRIYGLMDAFTVCDKYFSDVSSQSFPNHAFAIGADAEGWYANPGKKKMPIQVPGVPVRLEGAGKTWGNYGGGFAFPQYTDARMHANVHPSDQLLTDAAEGKLPDVSWVYAPSGKDFHPGDPRIRHSDGSSMAASDVWMGEAMRALVAGKMPDGSALWDRLVVFITFDDWGGWDDHVEPPVLERFPADHPQFPDDPYRYGSRVPCVVISPYAKPQHVSSVASSHTSLVAFIERLWGLPPSPSRQAAARTRAVTEQAMADCFDFAQQPLKAPQVPD
jgi:phospholipase C